ncbi:MAG: hypothetical protein GX455_02790, partial [Phycisphaerae bacterium]|nr:hypothetical protein [Phycisphaerae bacterium]
HDYVPSDPRSDYWTDDYFQLEGSGKPLPDLVVSELTIPAPVVVQGASPWTWVTMTVKNNGPGILQSGTLRAEISGSTRNGESFTTSGFFGISYSAPLYPGQTATHDFAVGHSSSWPVGVYSLRVKVDPDDLIAEADEKNNLSAPLAFDIADERFLAGTIRYNGQPFPNLTQIPVSHHWVHDNLTHEYPDDYFFWYDTKTGHYLFSGLRNTDLYIDLSFHTAGPGDHLGGNYRVPHNVDLRLLTDAEAGSHDMTATQILHMIQPQDNGQVLEYSAAYPHCPGTRFEWAPVPGAVKYRIKIFLDRDVTHPSGPGVEGVAVETEIPDLAYTLSLPPSEEHFSYSMILKGYNASDEMLADYMRTFGGSKIGYGSAYPFKVCPSCARADINHDCRVNLYDLAILAEEWLMDTR